MKLLPIIEHMRTTLPAWFSRVDAAVSHELALDRSRIELEGTKETLPAFYLMLGGDNVINIIPQPHVVVDFEEILYVIAVLKNIDETGKYAQDQVHDIRKVLMSCLLNYQADDDAKSLVYDGSKFLFLDKARFVYEFRFKQYNQFDIGDGNQLDLDYFDTLWVDWNLAYASEESKPNAQDHIRNIYPLEN